MLATPFENPHSFTCEQRTMDRKGCRKRATHELAIVPNARPIMLCEGHSSGRGIDTDLFLSLCRNPQEQ